MPVKISKSVHYHTFGVQTMGFGFVNMVDNRKPYIDQIDGTNLFVHKLSEDVNYLDLTELQKAEIKKDCDDLVRLLGKFYHESEYYEEK